MGTLTIRIKDMGISLKTPPAKMGRIKGEKLAGKSRAEKLSEYTVYQEARKRFPPEFHHLIDKAEKGSKNAEIACFCIECVGFEREEVRLCTAKKCFHYPSRPYKTNEEKQA